MFAYNKYNISGSSIVTSQWLVYQRSQSYEMEEQNMLCMLPNYRPHVESVRRRHVHANTQFGFRAFRLETSNS